jgi:hypothetical protein
MSSISGWFLSAAWRLLVEAGGADLARRGAAFEEAGMAGLGWTGVM